jgi:kinetochore protein Spc7/SPC105
MVFVSFICDAGLIIFPQHQLNLIRTNARGLAKSEWYDWKLRWIEGLREKADKGFEDLTQVSLVINS